MPLNDESGLIQWIEDTKGFRNIIRDIYSQKGLLVTGKQLKDAFYPLSMNLNEKIKVFENKLIKMHPDVFHEWFYMQFPNPVEWFNAKIAFIRTLAVMSMIGYVLGLGDRHGENILFNSNSGIFLRFSFIFSGMITWNTAHPS